MHESSEVTLGALNSQNGFLEFDPPGLGVSSKYVLVETIKDEDKKLNKRDKKLWEKLVPIPSGNQKLSLEGRAEVSRDLISRVASDVLSERSFEEKESKKMSPPNPKHK